MKNLIQVKPLKCPLGNLAIISSFLGLFVVLFGLAFAYFVDFYGFSGYFILYMYKKLKNFGLFSSCEDNLSLIKVYFMFFSDKTKS